MADKSSPTTSTKDLTSKVHEWLATEGYPLEFLAANCLHTCGFQIRQGEYVRGRDEEVAREIDVLAALDHWDDDYIMRVYQVVECKWSRDRPWVVFTSVGAQISESACAAQAIGSVYGTAIMWAMAGHRSIRQMNLFSSPERPGFNGREALAKGTDRFYGSMKSVTDLTTKLVDEYDREPRPKGKPPRFCVVAFPIILVDGSLFEAYFCVDEHKTKLHQVNHVRCHWKGSPTWQYHSTIDIVTLDFFPDFCSRRFQETKTLLECMIVSHKQVLTCFQKGTLKALEVKPGGRGIVGIPPLLKEVSKHNAFAKKSSMSKRNKFRSK